MIECAYYPHKRIASPRSLALALCEDEQWIAELSAKASELYFPGKPTLKKDGTLRETFDTRPGLKRVLKKTNAVFLKQVIYPRYLHGALPKRACKSNSETHVGASVVLSLDIKSFFPSITAHHVYSVWAQLFKFTPRVCELMTNLTCCNGSLVQGAPTSSYLANLVFWDVEPTVVQKLAERGFRYTRYVDDISVSVTRVVSDTDVAWAISQIYAMLGSRGLRANRKKEQIMRSHRPVVLLGLVSNRKPSLNRVERHRIRAEVHKQMSVPESERLATQINSTIGKVQLVRRFHPEEGRKLLRRLSDKLPF